MNTFQNIKAQQVVYYRTAQGQIRKGKACPLLLFPGHVVIDIGRGRPQVVNANNYVPAPREQYRPE